MSADPFTAARPEFQIARARGARPLPIGAYEVAEFRPRRTWRFWLATALQAVAVAAFTAVLTAILLSPLYS